MLPIFDDLRSMRQSCLRLECATRPAAGVRGNYPQPRQAKPDTLTVPPDCKPARPQSKIGLANRARVLPKGLASRTRSARPAWRKGCGYSSRLSLGRRPSSRSRRPPPNPGRHASRGRIGGQVSQPERKLRSERKHRWNRLALPAEMPRPTRLSLHPERIRPRPEAAWGRIQP